MPLDYQHPQSRRAERRAWWRTIVGTREAASLGRPLLFAVASLIALVAATFLPDPRLPGTVVAGIGIDIPAILAAAFGVGLSVRRVDSEGCLGTLGGLILLLVNATLLLASASWVCVLARDLIG